MREVIPYLGQYYDAEEGILVPPGYEPISHRQSLRKQPKGKVLRWSSLMHKPYRFDPASPEFHAFLDQCRKDTAALRKQMNAVFLRRELKFYSGDKKKTGKRRVEFLIRPPYFHGEFKEISAATRFQKSPNKSHVYIQKE